MKIDEHTREEFLDAFLECAEWSSTWPEDESDDSEPIALDSWGYYWSDDSVKSARVLCNDFIDANLGLLSDPRIDSGQAGHDLWLTAQGHGCGFWDRGHERLGDALTEAAKHSGCFDHCYPHNGELHFSP